ncbi:hypothetical protein Tco_1398300, partial [Tanacetum coccineum]
VIPGWFIEDKGAIGGADKKNYQRKGMSKGAGDSSSNPLNEPEPESGLWVKVDMGQPSLFREFQWVFCCSMCMGGTLIQSIEVDKISARICEEKSVSLLEKLSLMKKMVWSPDTSNPLFVCIGRCGVDGGDGGGSGGGGSGGESQWWMVVVGDGGGEGGGW